VATPYLSEIRIFSFNFAPKGWAFCDGQLLSIQQYTALFSLIGTYYGGDGVRTFALPNLQARVPLHQGSGFVIGQPGGSQTITLNSQQVASHSHTAFGTALAADAPLASTNFLGATASNTYGPLGTTTTPLQPATVGNAGGNLPHDNMQPYLVLNFCIALVGIFPTQN
jgi:microcystin-dependent protein